MLSERNKLYAFITISLFLGYAWIVIGYTGSIKGYQATSICFIKHATDLPCPSCGSTRAILLLLKGDFLESLQMNPIGILLFIMMLCLPFWILHDCFTLKNSLLHFYKAAENKLRQKSIAIPSVTLILMNWIWNIYKNVQTCFNNLCPYRLLNLKPIELEVQILGTSTSEKDCRNRTP